MSIRHVLPDCLGMLGRVALISVLVLIGSLIYTVTKESAQGTVLDQQKSRAHQEIDKLLASD